jgi:DNA-binding FrmR family transcriptional regulator
MEKCHCKEKALVSFRKALSSLNKVVKMTEADQYCIDIMQQSLAVMGLLKSANQMLLQNHLETCFKEAMSSKDKDKQLKMIKELLMVNKLANK